MGIRAAVLCIPLDFAGDDGVGIETHAVIRHLCRADVPKALDKMFGSRVSVAQEIGVARHPEHRPEPDGEGARPLQEESGGMLTFPKAEEEAFACVAKKQIVESNPALPRQGFQPGVDGMPHVLDDVHAHEKASRYGRITLSTRHRHAACQRRFLSTRRSSKASRRAATATSRPILFLYWKQSARVCSSP